MPEFYNKGTIFYQNLLDAGCNDQDIKNCMKLYENNEDGKLIQQLDNYRKSLLVDLHQAQYKIDCLDHLLYQLKSNK